MFLKIVLIIAATFISPMTTVGQQSQSVTQAQQVIIETPEVVTLELVPLTRRRSAGVYEKVSGPFNPQSRIRFELMATNTSIIPLDVRSWDTFSQNRPRLFRDNQEVAYREEIKDLLTNKEKQGAEIIHLFVIHLAPNQRKVVETLTLSDWYEPLGPGYYRFSTQHRFIDGGKWVDSESIVFEVEEKRTSPESKR